MTDNPVLILLMLGGAAYLFHLWLSDYRSIAKGETPAGALPGAFPAPATAILVAVGGAMIILGAEVGGEYALRIVEDQSEITVLFGVFMLTAAFFEELIFRGYLVVQKRGRAMLIISILFFSTLFTLAHPFLWDFDSGESAWRFWEGTFTLDFSTSAWFSTSIVFINSLWFYTVRFYALNPKASLIPCFAAHLASNAGVFAVKGAQGFVTGWW